MSESWVTRDYGGEGKALHLSKSSLGLFVYHLLKLKGSISSVYALNAEYDRSYVQMAITLPKGRKEKLEELTGVTLEKPPQIKLA